MDSTECPPEAIVLKKKRWWYLLSNSIYISIKWFKWNIFCRYNFLTLTIKVFYFDMQDFLLAKFFYQIIEFFTHVKEIRFIIICLNMLMWIQMWQVEMVVIWETYILWFSPYCLFFLNLSLCFLLIYSEVLPM